MEAGPKQFSTPQEEIEFLRQQIATKERELLDRRPEADSVDMETVGKMQMREYTSFTPQRILHPEYELEQQTLHESVKLVETASDPVEEILQIAAEKGIKNALTVLERSDNAFIIDEVHRKLIERIQTGVQVGDLKEGVPPWHVLHMTLYEVSMPAVDDGADGGVANLVGAMEQWYAGLRTIGSAKEGNHFVLEIAVAERSSHIIFYVAVPNEYTTLFEKQTLSLFPHAQLTVQPHDYNMYVDGGHTLVADISLKKHPIYPLRSAEEFSTDPVDVILNAFSQIDHLGEGAALQFVVQYPSRDYKKAYDGIIRQVEKGMKPKEAIARSTVGGDVLASVNELLFSGAKKETAEQSPKEVDTQALELFKTKVAKPLLGVNIRLVVSADALEKAEATMKEIQSAFNQFDAVDGNQIVFTSKKGMALRQAQKAFSFRQVDPKNALPLSATELATLAHFPRSGIETPQFKQSYSDTAAAPTDMPTEGTMLGVNKHRGAEKDIFISEKDRMRHFYVIGQTGTGKSIFLQNMIVQDIQSGAGVCMIDPHGTDIQDVMAAIPPEREKDVIYFDPSHLERSIGLNMLEYDPQKPEQKTFVVNELLSIFQKLYGANPESMGPMFEQYFRNATMLVMEDPASGNTLMDIGRVMADARFRRAKLEKATNPTVISFWKDIATKAGGEASLENVVPYIVSKIDPLTANDYLRPIIGQQTSAFNFRQIMDERKILLVNLSKGRLGEINSSLIGMIFVGKILMAALSRVDDPTMSFPPFYLHIDEFQNISTPSIAAILSEARKYKLGLTVAHQFIAQLDPVIRDAVFGNVGSLAAFRVGNEDAQALESQFAPVFSAKDLMNTPNYNAVLRVLANGTPTPAFSAATLPPPQGDPDKAAALMAQSYAQYGRPRAEIEAEIAARYQRPAPPVPPAPSML